MLLYNVYSGRAHAATQICRATLSTHSSPLSSTTGPPTQSRGVDLTFGVDQYDRTVGGSTSQTTSYSYQVSKSLFNDRFKIVVGGNYSTDANADENFSENLIKDISFEYFLNKAQTMYLRLFRHTGYESILEGEITRTGVGFVYSANHPRCAVCSSVPRTQRSKTEAPANAQDSAKENENSTKKHGFR